MPEVRAEKGPVPTSASAWHAMKAPEVFAQLGSNEGGLPSAEAQKRLAQYGPNRLRPPRRQGRLARFFLQFHNVLIYVLLGAAIIAALLSHWVDTGVILAVVVINALIGFIQEGKAERAIEAVRKVLSLQATVIREARRVTIPAQSVVPGDVVALKSGDKVPADMRLFASRDLRIDEAVLTGESVPTEKSSPPVEENATLGDQHGMAFSGTLVTYGQGLGVVTATGDDTEIGRISAMIQEVEKLTTPLLKKISTFGRILSLVVLVVSVLTFAFGVWVRGYAPTYMFMAAVATAVAAIPEGLPAIMTITLAIGVQRMARRNAIIRRLPAVDTLGSVTVICSDKTGTLTRNEMTVTVVVTRQTTYDVSGVGYAPHGQFTSERREIDVAAHPALCDVLRAATLCSDATITEQESGRWMLQGDPTEGAIVTAAIKASLDVGVEQQAWPRDDAVPFASEHKYMATLHHSRDAGHVIFVKGAPERVLQMCHKVGSLSEAQAIDRQHWEERARELASRGQRVLAVAYKTTDGDKCELQRSDVQSDLTLLGLLGIIDPPREEAIRAIRRCQEAGIRVKMITGDHALTATVIGKQLNIGDGRRVLTGAEVAAMSDADLQAAARETDVFARVNPEHKLKLVTAIQADNQVVSMTGDGVNDAPALKRADIGVAMGQKGTEVAKESSDMVLTDDNFASIAHAVEEGRTVYDNLRKAILFILPTSGGESMMIVGAIVLGRDLPITPVQILWVNMITAVTLALALAFEPPEEGVMQRPPRDPDAPLLSGFFIWRISFVSFLMFVATFGAFLLTQVFAAPGVDPGQALQHAQTVAVNTLVMLEAVYLFNTRYITDSALTRRGLLGSPHALVAVAAVLFFQMLFTYLPSAQALFHTQPIGPYEWLRIVLIALLVFLIVELEKTLMRRRSGFASGQ